MKMNNPLDVCIEPIYFTTRSVKKSGTLLMERDRECEKNVIRFGRHVFLVRRTERYRSLSFVIRVDYVVLH